MKYILFDLDGTLLPMDQEEFTQNYFKYLAQTLKKYGYDRKQLIDAIWQGTASMIKNDGLQTNEEVFWKTFASIFGDKVYRDQILFEQFYQTEFNEIKHSCGFDPNVQVVIRKLKELGYKLVVATNPIFPSIAQESRIRWAGLDEHDFEFYTTYENMHYCKPNPKYYLEIIEKLNCQASDCLMVGNDVCEDMIASKIGMQVFLLTNHLINKNNLDLSIYPKGDFLDLLRYIEKNKTSI